MKAYLVKNAKKYNRPMDNILEKASQIVNSQLAGKESYFGLFHDQVKKTASVYNLMSPNDKQLTVQDVYLVLVYFNLVCESCGHKEDNLIKTVACLSAMNNYLEHK